MRQYLPTAVNGWVLQDTVETYDRETIFDYIDGAGEVYRSYAFREVSVFHYKRSDQPEITVELFDLGSDQDAFGIFSHARESEATGIGQGYEYRSGLLCFWQASFFVCLSTESGLPELKEASFTLARDIAQQLPPGGNRPDLVDYLPQSGLRPATVRYFHLPASLNYHYYLSHENILNLSEKTRAVIAQYESGAHLLCAEYSSESDATLGYDGFIRDYAPEARDSGVAEISSGKWLAITQSERYVVIALDAPGRQQALSLRDELSQKLSIK